MPDIEISRRERSRRRWRRYLLIGAGVATLVTAGLLALFLIPGGAAVPRSSLLIATVQSGRLAIRVQAPGNLAPKVRRWVTAVAPGVVQDVKVQPGDKVKADAVLAVLANPRLDAALVSAKSGLATAQSNLVSLRAKLQNQLLDLESDLAGTEADARAAKLKAEAQQGLVADHVVAKLDYERSRLDAEKFAQQVRLTKQRIAAFRDNMAAQIKAQDAKVDALRAALNETQSEVDSLKVRAHLAGVVQDVAVQEGQTLKEGGNIARIASLAHLKAVLQVSPNEAGELAVGQAAAITLDTGSNATVQGAVSRIAPSVSHGSVAVDVTLPQDLPQGARPNLSVSGVVSVATVAHTLYVQRPVYSRPDSTQTLYKLVSGGNAAVPVKVRLGRASDQAIQVLAGLRAGDRVIVSDTSDFSGHKRIRIQ